jgi:DNA-directed RNA polymerase subunit RPC12/RpoP
VDTSMIEFSCYHCLGIIKARDDWEGKEVNCPHCAWKIEVPLITKPAFGQESFSRSPTKHTQDKKREIMPGHGRTYYFVRLVHPNGDVYHWQKYNRDGYGATKGYNWHHEWGPSPYSSAKYAIKAMQVGLDRYPAYEDNAIIEIVRFKDGGKEEVVVRCRRVKVGIPPYFSYQGLFEYAMRSFGYGREWKTSVDVRSDFENHWNARGR